MEKYLKKVKTLTFLITLNIFASNMVYASELTLLSPFLQILNLANTYDNYKKYPAMEDPPYVVHKQVITNLKSDPYINENTTVTVLHTYPCKEFTSADESGIACERSDGTWEIMD